MMRPLSILGLCLAFAVVAALVLADDGMATCQTLHSFDVCHATIH